MIEYAHTPPLSILSPSRAVVRCAKCNRKLTPNEPRPVRDMGNGRWECVTCPTVGRVPRGGRTLERLLRASLEVKP